MWGEPLCTFAIICSLKFQLTRPVWGEPKDKQRRLDRQQDFNSLAPCGANLHFVLAAHEHIRISTHSPRVGRTFDGIAEDGLIVISTHSPRVGRTNSAVCDILVSFISTHSPRVGRTKDTGSPFCGSGNFNSLAPCGANLNGRNTSQ